MYKHGCLIHWIARVKVTITIMVMRLDLYSIHILTQRLGIIRGAPRLDAEVTRK